MAIPTSAAAAVSLNACIVSMLEYWTMACTISSGPLLAIRVKKVSLMRAS